MCLPMSFFVFWIFKPLHFFARKTYPDEIHPSVSVDIHSLADKGIAVTFVILKLLRRLYLMLFPLRCFEPIRSCHDINLPVLIDIAHSHTLGDKILKKNMLFERN